MLHAPRKVKSLSANTTWMYPYLYPDQSEINSVPHISRTQCEQSMVWLIDDEPHQVKEYLQLTFRTSLIGWENIDRHRWDIFELLVRQSVDKDGYME